jgi:site-specific DNA recombinase
MIWNRREWVLDPDTGRSVPRLRPKGEWVEKDLPKELRIVDQALWERVQARRKSRPQMKKGTPVMNAKYLLSGLLTCGVCGSRFVIADTYRYGCAGLLNRVACSNDLRVRRELVETRCLDGLRKELFTPERFALFIKEMTRLLAERKRQQRPDLGRLHKELARVEAEIVNLLNAIKLGILTATTKAELERLETERDRLRARQQDGTQQIDKVVALLPRAKERYEAVVNNLAHVPQRHIGPMREQIRSLVGEITLRPRAEGYLEAEMIGRYEGLLKLAVGGSRNTVGCGGRI